MLKTTLYGTGLYDTGSPAVQVRVLRGDRLVALELCEDECEAEDLLQQWSEMEGVSFVVDDIAARDEPDDVVESKPPVPDGPEFPIAVAPVPARGAE